MTLVFTVVPVLYIGKQLWFSVTYFLDLLSFSFSFHNSSFSFLSNCLVLNWAVALKSRHNMSCQLESEFWDNWAGYMFPYELYIQLRIVSFIPCLYITKRNLVFWIPFTVLPRKPFGFTLFFYILFSFIPTWRNMIYLCRTYIFLWSNQLRGVNDEWVYRPIQEVTFPFLSPSKDLQLVSLPPQEQKFLEWDCFY